jgi:thiol-disulfide isomerase/thioredoxin
MCRADVNEVGFDLGKSLLDLVAVKRRRGVLPMHKRDGNFETLAAIVPENKVRFESREHTGWYVVVSDGKTMWRAVPYTREYAGTAVTGSLLEIKGGGPEAEMALRRMKLAATKYDRLKENLKSAHVIRNEVVEVGASPIDCVVVRGEYDPPRGSVGIKAITRTYWIDKARFLVLREESVTQGNLSPMTPSLEMEIRSVMKYTVASVNQPPPESLFTYVAPADFRAMNKLERAFLRPTLDLIGKPAPDLTLSTLDGRQMPLSSLRGKVVLLDFWATWCAPCRDQMPAIAKLVKETRDQGLIVLGINDDETPEKAASFANEQKLDWPSLFDGKQHEAREKYKVDGIPTLVLIDKQGVVVEYQLGSGPAIDAAIRAALRKQGISTD